MVADLELSSTNMFSAKNGGQKYSPSSTGERKFLNFALRERPAATN